MEDRTFFQRFRITTDIVIDPDKNPTKMYTVHQPTKGPEERAILSTAHPGNIQALLKTLSENDQRVSEELSNVRNRLDQMNVRLNTMETSLARVQPQRVFKPKLFGIRFLGDFVTIQQQRIRQIYLTLLRVHSEDQFEMTGLPNQIIRARIRYGRKKWRVNVKVIDGKMSFSSIPDYFFPAKLLYDCLHDSSG